MTVLLGYIVRHDTLGTYKIPKADLAGWCRSQGFTKKDLLEAYNSGSGKTFNGWQIVADWF